MMWPGRLSLVRATRIDRNLFVSTNRPTVRFVLEVKLNSVHIHRHLHDVFGEAQRPAQLIAILSFGIAVPAILAVTMCDLTGSVAPWRSVLALLLVLDIAAGCVANFTRGTSDFYAGRPRNRWVFIAIHIHVVAVAGLLNTDLIPSIAVWGYTIAGAILVNLLAGKPSQTFAGGLLLGIGLTGIGLWPGLSPFMTVVCTLFMLKVLFSFAVDHYNRG